MEAAERHVGGGQDAALLWHARRDTTRPAYDTPCGAQNGCRNGRSNGRSRARSNERRRATLPFTAAALYAPPPFTRHRIHDVDRYP